MPAARSTAFVSFDDTQPRISEGINGALAPARPHRAPPPQPPQQQLQHRGPSSNIYAANDDNKMLPATLGQQQGRRRSSDDSFGRTAGKLVSGDGGISLQETEARIIELERSEFDLKLKLFYMEEQLEKAAGGADVLQLHKETMRTKVVSTAKCVLAGLSRCHPCHHDPQPLLLDADTPCAALESKLLVDFDYKKQPL